MGALATGVHSFHAVIAVEDDGGKRAGASRALLGEVVRMADTTMRPALEGRAQLWLVHAVNEGPRTTTGRCSRRGREVVT